MDPNEFISLGYDENMTILDEMDNYLKHESDDKPTLTQNTDVQIDDVHNNHESPKKVESLNECCWAYKP